MAEGFAANVSTLEPLRRRCRFNHLQAATLCGVSPRTYRRWRLQGKAPASALRLLAILAGYVPWAGWAGWEVHGGLLFPPGFSRGGIGPGELGAIPYWRELVGVYRAENERLRTLLGCAQAQAPGVGLAGRQTTGWPVQVGKATKAPVRP